MGVEVEGCGDCVVDDADADAALAAVVGCAAADDVRVRLLCCGDAETSAKDDSESSLRFSRPHLAFILGDRILRRLDGDGKGDNRFNSSIFDD